MNHFWSKEICLIPNVDNKLSQLTLFFGFILSHCIFSVNHLKNPTFTRFLIHSLGFFPFNPCPATSLSLSLFDLFSPGRNSVSTLIARMSTLVWNMIINNKK